MKPFFLAVAIALSSNANVVRSAQDVGPTSETRKEDLRALASLSKWSDFSADFVEEIEASGAYVVGGEKHAFIKGSVARSAYTWRWRFDEVSRADSLIDGGHRSRIEILRSADGRVQLHMRFPELKLTNEALLAGNPFRFLESPYLEGGKEPAIAISFDSSKRTIPRFWPIMMSTEETRAVPDTVVEEILRLPASEWKEKATVLGKSCKGVCHKVKERSWNVFICPESDFSILKADWEIVPTPTQPMAKCSWEVTEMGENWTHFTVIQKIEADLGAKGIRKDTTKIRFSNIRFGSGADGLAPTMPIIDGTPVTLVKEPQTKAEWRNGKIVRIP